MKLLRRAFEAHNTDSEAKKTITISGPLSEVYTKALQIAYCKTDPILNEPMVEDLKKQEPAMEAAAQMVQMLHKIVKNLEHEHDDQTPHIYAVSRNDLNEQEYVNIAQSAASNTGEFIAVVDATQPGNATPVSSAPVTTIVSLDTALEALVTKLGGLYFHSLEEYCDHLETKLNTQLANENAQLDKEVQRQLDQPGEVPSHLTFPQAGMSVRVFATRRNEIDLPSYVEITNQMVQDADETPVVVTVDVSPNGEMETKVGTVAVEGLAKVAKRLGKPFFSSMEAYLASLK